jgi:hypothetical protein
MHLKDLLKIRKFQKERSDHTMFIRLARYYAAFLLTFALLAGSLPIAAFVPDEGMYTPDQISRLPLKKRGLKIPVSQLYDPSAPSVSDAIMRVNISTGGFGTGEFVSPEGLILTNHHVGFDALVASSTESRDLAAEGFTATSIKDELPAKGYTLMITKRVEDVTAKVLEGTESLSGEARTEKLEANRKALETAEQSRAADSTVRVQELNDGLYYYLYETQLIKDVRVVYAPPQNIGFFGGDPDNFEWTRHTGDFTFLRAYVSPNGEFAEYSKDNVPYKPKKYLTISLDGISDGDFVMVMGYPGGTTRYRESSSIAYSQNVNFPFIADYVRSWSEALSLVSEEEPEKAIPLQTEIFSLNNAQKVYEGNVVAMKRADIIGRRQKLESRIATWINSDAARRSKYGDLFGEFEKIASIYYKTAARDRAIGIFPSSSTTKAFAAAYSAIGAVSEGRPLGSNEEERSKAKEKIEAVFEDFDPILEREMIKFFLRKIRELPEGQKFLPAEKLFGGLGKKERSEAEAKFAAKVADRFSSAEKVIAIYDTPLNKLMEEMPDVVSLSLGLREARADYGARTAVFNKEISPLRLKYEKALSEFEGRSLYPDANGTLRFTYGNVKGYSPREAVIYKPFTTLRGVIEKDTGVEPFDVPERLKELQAAGDFGVYGSGGSVPVNFLSTTDIIGGNSGSPVLNGKGEQVGIVFDGNYEGLGNDIFFSDDYDRTISVDIRYVLFLTERFGTAGWILKEMSIKKPKSRK